MKKTQQKATGILSYTGCRSLTREKNYILSSYYMVYDIKRQCLSATKIFIWKLMHSLNVHHVCLRVWIVDVDMFYLFEYYIMVYEYAMTHYMIM